MKLIKTINPAQVCGAIHAPPSKSMTLRAYAAGLLSAGKTEIVNPSYCADAMAAAEAIIKLGAKIEEISDRVIVTGNPPSPSLGAALGAVEINCRESGLCMRMFSAVAALYPRKIVITGEGTLKTRPVGPVERPMRSLGANCKTSDGFLPIEICGPAAGGETNIDGTSGSQFLTGLLMAMPLAATDSSLYVDNLTSRPYIDMTLELLNDFGIEVVNDSYKRFFVKGKRRYARKEYYVEGDWSGASFFLCAAALNGEAKVYGLKAESRQADRRIIDALKMAGAEVDLGKDYIEVRKKDLRRFDFDATDCPDLFPPLAVLACGCEGTSEIKGVGRLRIKESNRALALMEELNSIGGAIRIDGDIMIIKGGKLLGGKASSRGDHRMAMALGIAGLCSISGVDLSGAGCVDKSYPGFWEDMRGLSAKAAL